MTQLPALLRRTPPAVWLLVAAFGLLLCVQALLYPVYRAPDEPAHVDMIRTLAAGGPYPRLGEHTLSPEMVASYAVVGHDEVDPGAAPRLVAPDAPPRAQRPSYGRLRAALGPASGENTGRLQQMAAHPPAYYLLASAVYDAVEHRPLDQVVMALRLLSIVLVVPLPLLCHLVATRLGAGPAVGLAAATVPLGIPQLTHIGSVVNNDNLLVLLGAALALPLAAVARGDLSRATATAVGVLLGLALLTKGFALVFPLWVALAYALAARNASARAVPPALLALTLGGAVGGWWWLRNLLVHGRLQPGLPVPPPDSFTADPGFWVPFFMRRMVRRFWFEPDILQGGGTQVAVAATLGLLALLFAALVLRHRHRLSTGDLLVLLAPAALLGALVVFGAWRVYANTSITAAIHGRYLYPGLVGLAVASAAGGAALLGRTAHRLPVLLLIAATALQGLSALWALEQYWGAAVDTGLSGRIDALLAWAPWPPSVVWAVLLGAPVTCLAALAAVSVMARARPAGHRSAVRARR